jgi:hypothetical protein
MFVSQELSLDISYAVARARFDEFSRSGWLTDASGRAHADGLSGLIRVGPFGAVLGASKLVRVQTLEPVTRGDAVALPLRWEATGALGRLFPVLDADLILTPEDTGGTRLELKGVYRAPLAGIGSAADRLVLHRAATATARALLRDVAGQIGAPAEQPAGPPPKHAHAPERTTGQLRMDAWPETSC